MNQTNAAAAKLVLLIDAENLPSKFAGALIAAARQLGSIVATHVYGHFGSVRLSGWSKAAAHHGLRKVDVTRTTTGKNAADFKLVVEAMDMLHGRKLDGFCIASSDGDFTALVERLKASAVTVYGFGESKAPQSYRDLFDRYFDCAKLDDGRTNRAKPVETAKPQKAAAAKPATPKAKPPKPHAPARSHRPIPEATILKAIDDATADDGWAHLSNVGKNIRRGIPDFEVKHYGFRTMRAMLDATKGVETRAEAGSRVFVRRKPR